MVIRNPGEAPGLFSATIDIDPDRLLSFLWPPCSAGRIASGSSFRSFSPFITG